MAEWHKKYIAQFLTTPGFNDAVLYDVSIDPAKVVKDQTYWRCIGIHHLTGAENHGQHNVFCDVVDEQGKRLNGATLVVINVNHKINHIRIDKPDNEPGTNAPMHFGDTLEFYVATGGLPSDHAKGFHIRHEDEEVGTTRGHHSFYAVWQRTIKRGTTPPIEPPPIEEPPPPPVPTANISYNIGEPAIYITAGDVRIAQTITREWAIAIVAGLKLLEASERDHRAASYVEGLRGLLDEEA